MVANVTALSRSPALTIASVACGTAGSLTEIVAFRIIQRLGGGGILTIARSILRDTFPPDQIGRSQALLALGAVVGPSVGPTLGGILTDSASWRWIFINVVPGVASVTLLGLLRRTILGRQIRYDHGSGHAHRLRCRRSGASHP